MKKRNFLAVLASLAVMTSMFGISASAVGTNYNKGLTKATVTKSDGTTEPVSKNTTSFDKYLVMDTNANVPNAAFNFAIAKYNAEKAEKEIIANANDTSLAVMNGVEGAVFTVSKTADEDAVFTPADLTTTEKTAKTPETANTAVVFRTESDTDEKFAAKNLVLDFSGVQFDEPGIYRYIITETGSNQGIENDTVTDRTLDVYVEDYADFYNKIADDKKADYTTPNGKELFIANYVLYSGKNDNAPSKDGSTTLTKSNSYTNTYATQNLEFGKKVTGNQGSKDKYFKFTLTLNNVAGATLNVIPNGMEKEPTANSATIYDANTMKTANSIDENDSIDNQQIVVPTGENSVTKEFYLNDGQYVKIEGLPKGAEYTLTEDEEDYTQTNGTDKEWETGKTYNDATTGTINTDDIHTGFTNDRSGTIPTGVILSVAAPVIIGLAVLGGIIFLVIRNKKRENEDEED